MTAPAFLGVVNPADAASQFIDAMCAAGIEPIEPIAAVLASGQPVRFRAQGDRKGRKNGWAQLHLDGIPAGVFRHYRLGIRETWCMGRADRELSASERRQIADNIRAIELQRRRETEAKQSAAAREVAALWDGANRADPAQGYLVRKGLEPFGVLQRGSDLLVPMLDREWRLWNVQRIRPDGFKLFHKGARTAGLFWPHGIIAQDGRPTAGPIVIAEGYATAAAIWQWGPPCGVVAAMSARNLEAVAATMQSLYPSRELIVAADDDCHLSPNMGLEAARKAAEAVGARLATPAPLSLETRSQADFADIAAGKVRARIEAAAFAGEMRNG
jgi:putative DNA primase/helicase